MSKTAHRYAHLHGTLNQLGNSKNPYQGNFKRVLFLCSAGLLRSATAAHTFSEAPYNWNTRTAGVETEYALNPVNEALLVWADVVYCMEGEHVTALKRIFGDKLEAHMHKIKVLCVPDSYQYRDPGLVQALKQAIENAELPTTDEDTVVVE